MKVKWRNILVAVGLLLAVVLLVDFNRRMEELDRLTTQLNAVRAEGTSVMMTQTALVTQVAYATSDQAVKDWAYTNQQRQPDEKPIVLVPGGNVTPTPEPPPAAAMESQPNWRVWWELFFGENH